MVGKNLLCSLSWNEFIVKGPSWSHLIILILINTLLNRWPIIMTIHIIKARLRNNKHKKQHSHCFQSKNPPPQWSSQCWNSLQCHPRQSCIVPSRSPFLKIIKECFTKFSGNVTLTDHFHPCLPLVWQVGFQRHLSSLAGKTRTGPARIGEHCRSHLLPWNHERWTIASCVKGDQWPSQKKVNFSWTMSE